MTFKDNVDIASQNPLDPLEIFLEGCLDRPSSFPEQGDLVSFHGSWKRKFSCVENSECCCSSMDQDSSISSNTRKKNMTTCQDKSQIAEKNIQASDDGNYSKKMCIERMFAPDIPGKRHSSIYEISRLIHTLMICNIRSLAFCKTRKYAELVLRYCREQLEKKSFHHLSSKIRCYRGGYQADQRREIEQELFRGEILAVAGTSALELGVDLGFLDVTLHLGYPGSQTSLWQQFGRAGRGQRNSIAIIVFSDNPLDQYLCSHPSKLLQSPLENPIINENNVMVLKAHCICGINELKLQCRDWENQYWGDMFPTVLDELLRDGLLYCESKCEGEECYYLCHRSRATSVSIRSIEQIMFQIIDNTNPDLVRLIEEIG